MESVMDEEPSPSLFNSPLETGLRAVILLDALYPRRLGLEELALYDYFVVHTGDINGPPSLHPPISSRPGEYRIRRRLIEEGLRLMQRIHFVNAIEDDRGILFEASDAAPRFVDRLRTPYNDELRARARWLADRETAAETAAFEQRLRDSIEHWTFQFEAEIAPGSEIL